MKYVNVNTVCYQSVSIIDDRVVAFNAPLRSVKYRTENSENCIDEFVVVTQIGFIGTKNDEHRNENILCNREAVDVIIRLTKRTKTEEHRLGIDLDQFSVDLQSVADEGLIEEACYEYYNYTRITDVRKVDLPAGPGAYVIKVLMKKHSEPKYSIQSIGTIIIN